MKDILFVVFFFSLFNSVPSMWKNQDKNQIPILELPRQIMVPQDSQVFGKLVWLKEVETSLILYKHH